MNPTKPPSKNNFSIEARKCLVEKGWTITHLGTLIGHPRETVSKAVRSSKFPNVRRKVAKKLGLLKILPS